MRNEVMVCILRGNLPVATDEFFTFFESSSKFRFCSVENIPISTGLGVNGIKLKRLGKTEELCDEVLGLFPTRQNMRQRKFDEVLMKLCRIYTSFYELRQKNVRNEVRKVRNEVKNP